MRLFRPRADTRLIGQIAEDKALLILERKGLKLVCRNHHCRAGELDLIMLDQDTLVFIEVRFRRQTHFGSGADTVDYRKQQKIIRAAQHFLQNQGYSQLPACRFDVLAATLTKKNETSLQFDWIKNAFDLQ